jgi:hypothetical protein
MKSKFRSTLVVCIAAIAFTAVGVTGASAATGGPEWLVNGKALEVGKTKAVNSTSIIPITIEESAGDFVCTNESGTGEIIGGIPGTGAGTITFTGCSIEGKRECKLSGSSSGNTTAPGEITFAYKTVLVYPQSGTAEALEAIVPGGTKINPNEFTGVTLSGGEPACGVFNGKSFEFKATGTQITEPGFDKACGMLARVGQIKAGAFATLASGEQASEGALGLPGVTITKASLRTKTVQEITCGSEFLFGQPSISTTLKQTTSPAELFGWEV